MAEAAFPGIEDAFAQCFGQGLHHIDAERLQDAASSLRRAAALRPDHPVAWFVLGLTLRTLGQGTDALAPLRAALRLRPDDPDTLFHLAGLLMEQARATEAVPVLRRLVWLRPDHPEAAFMLGNALMAVEEPEQAETTYRWRSCCGRTLPTPTTTWVARCSPNADRTMRWGASAAPSASLRPALSTIRISASAN